MMAFADVRDAWKDPANGQWLQSYTITTGRERADGEGT
jgi:hypothetical protein